MAEQSIAPVCKTGGRKAYLGASPSLGTMTSGKRLLGKVAQYAVLLRGIAHPHRLAILHLLANDPTWPEDITRHMTIPQNLVSHHLKAMLRSGWIKKHREGKHVIYQLNKKAFKTVLKFLSPQSELD